MPLHLFEAGDALAHRHHLGNKGVYVTLIRIEFGLQCAHPSPEPARGCFGADHRVASVPKLDGEAVPVVIGLRYRGAGLGALLESIG